MRDPVSATISTWDQNNPRAAPNAARRASRSAASIPPSPAHRRTRRNASVNKLIRFRIQDLGHRLTGDHQTRERFVGCCQRPGRPVDPFIATVETQTTTGHTKQW
jgi:hypothetical protein